MSIFFYIFRTLVYLAIAGKHTVLYPTLLCVKVYNCYMGLLEDFANWIKRILLTDIIASTPEQQYEPILPPAPKPLTKTQKIMLDKLNGLSAQDSGQIIELAGELRRYSNRYSKNKLLITSASLFVTDDATANLVWFDKPKLMRDIKMYERYYIKGRYIVDDYGASIHNPIIQKSAFTKKLIDSSEDISTTTNTHGTWDSEFEGKLPAADSPWAKTRAKILQRDGYKCTWCGSETNLQIDHKTEPILGGTNELSNLQTLCVDCHQHKHDKIFDTDYDIEDDYGENFKPNKKIRAINKALVNNSKIHIEYLSSKNVHTSRSVRPKRLFRKYNINYLEGFCELRHEDRTFRISRMQKITII